MTVLAAQTQTQTPTVTRDASRCSPPWPGLRFYGAASGGSVPATHLGTLSAHRDSGPREHRRLLCRTMFRRCVIRGRFRSI